MKITNGRLVFEQYEKLTADGENGGTEIYMTISGLIKGFMAHGRRANADKNGVLI